jgi:hypothetical protein
MQRGIDLLNLFYSMYPNWQNTPSQIAIQTTNNGLITNVQSLANAPNYTLFIIGKGPVNSRTYTVVPIEQIVDLVYAPLSFPQISSSSTFGSTFPKRHRPLLFDCRIAAGNRPSERHFELDLSVSL